MRSFFSKMYICLFEPRKMGVFLGEKLFKSFIQLLLLAIIAITPIIVSLSFRDGISNSSRDEIENYLITKSLDTDLLIKDNTLTGSKGLAFLIDEAILFLNPKDEKLTIDAEYATYHIIEFNPKGVRVDFFNNQIFSKTYSELNVGEIDFSKIEGADYLELSKLIDIINVCFNNVKVGWVIENSIIALFDLYLTLIISALVLAFLVKMVNPMIGFKFRFKAALDAQVISLLCLFLMMLLKAEFIRYIGVILSAIYLFIAMISIIRIEVQKKEFNDKKKERE